MKTYIVIGLGRFGKSVAKRLFELGNEVLAIDDNDDNIQQVSGYVTHAVVGDARDEEVLRALGVRNYDCAIVAIGGDLAASILITLALKELGVPAVICKASNELNKRALERVGADRVIIPEREMAAKLAQSLASSSLLDFIELSSDYGIAEIVPPVAWVGKTIRELNVRAKYGVSVLSFKHENEMKVLPSADEKIAEGTTIIVLGTNEQIAKLQKL
jgi:trk system potassium uptake protein TrkA